jgi:glycosyltransferase involved in cell wall biosynthesis
MKKVMFLLDRYNSPYSGAESQLLKLIVQLQAKGIECSMSVLRSSAYIEENSFPCAVEVLNINRMLSPSAASGLFKFARKAKKNGFEVVHILLNDASIFAPPILKLVGLKVVVSRLDMGFWYSKLNLPILRVSRFFVDKVLANGLAVKNIVAQSEKYPPECITVIYNGIRDEQQLAAIKPVAIHERCGFNQQDPVIGIVASLYPIKRIEDLIAAVALVKKQVPNVRMVSLGGGDTEQYSAQIAKLGLAEHVFFMGAQSNPLDWISSFSIATLCSESEGFSNAIVEYLMCGIPVVCSNVGGNPEIVKDGINGRLYECGNVVELADYLMELIVNKSMYRNFQEAAKLSIGEQFTLPYFVDEHIKLYEAVQ